MQELEAQVQPLLGLLASVWVLLMHLIVFLAGGLDPVGQGNVCVRNKPSSGNVHCRYRFYNGTMQLGHSPSLARTSCIHSSSTTSSRWGSEVREECMVFDIITFTRKRYIGPLSRWVRPCQALTDLEQEGKRALAKLLGDTARQA